MKASMLKNEGKFRWASATLTAAQRLQPGSSAVLRELGGSKVRLRDFKGGVKDLEQANKLQPGHAFTLRMLGIAKGAHVCHLPPHPPPPPSPSKSALQKQKLQKLPGLQANKLQPGNAFTLRSLGMTKYRNPAPLPPLPPFTQFSPPPSQSLWCGCAEICISAR